MVNRIIVSLVVGLIAVSGILALLFLHWPMASETLAMLDCPLPSVPEKIPNLKIVDRGFTPEQVGVIAKDVFNLNGPVADKYGGFTVEEGMNSLTIYPLGGFIYQDGKFPMGEYNPPPNETALTDAQNFLEKLKANALTPSHASIKIGEPEISEHTMGSTVRIVFQLKFENISMGEIAISVGEGGEIWGCEGFWREVRPDGYVNTMPLDKALKLLPEKLDQELKKELAQYNVTSFPSIRKVRVQNISIRYHSKWLSEPQDYLLPVYLFNFKIEWSDKHPCYGPDLVYSAVLSAIDGEYIYGNTLTGIK